MWTVLSSEIIFYIGWSGAVLWLFGGRSIISVFVDFLRCGIRRNASHQNQPDEAAYYRAIYLVDLTPAWRILAALLASGGLVSSIAVFAAAFMVAVAPNTAIPSVSFFALCGGGALGGFGGAMLCVSLSWRRKHGTGLLKVSEKRAHILRIFQDTDGAVAWANEQTPITSIFSPQVSWAWVAIARGAAAWLLVTALPPAVGILSAGSHFAGDKIMLAVSACAGLYFSLILSVAIGIPLLPWGGTTAYNTAFQRGVLAQDILDIMA